MAMSSSDNFTDGENGYFEVEKILMHRTRGTLLELYIKWKNYPIGEGTWEPLCSLYDDIRNMAKSYFKKRNLQLMCKFGQIQSSIIIPDVIIQMVFVTVKPN